MPEVNSIAILLILIRDFVSTTFQKTTYFEKYDKMQLNTCTEPVYS